MNIELLRYIIESAVFLISGGALSYVLFFHAKRKEAEAKADEAHAKSLDSFANEWKTLYEKKEGKVKELEQRINNMQDEINDLKSRIGTLQGELNAAYKKIGSYQKDLDEALDNRCIVKDCENRIPPRKARRTRRQQKGQEEERKNED